MSRVKRSKIAMIRICVNPKAPAGQRRHVNTPIGSVQKKCPHKGCYKADGHAPKTHGRQATQRVKGGIRATR